MSVSLAVKGLAVLTAIPVVMLALWAEYAARERQNTESEPAVALSRARLAGIFAMAVQFTLFLATTEIRRLAPFSSYFIFMVAIFAQGRIIAGVELKIRGKQQASASTPVPAPEADMAVAWRAFFWALVGGALYIAGFAAPVIVATWVAKAFSFSQEIAALVMVSSAIVGMVAGLVINFALGPVYLRRVLPVREIQNDTLRSLLERCFQDAGQRVPAIWIVESRRVREATATLAGFPKGRWIFRPALFLAAGLVEALSEEQLRAVVLHEVAHLRLNHLRRRLIYSAALILGTTSAAIFVVLLANLLMRTPDWRNLAGFAAAAVAFISTFRLLSAQSRRHEAEADACAVGELGAGLSAFSEALRRIDAINDATNPLSTIGGRSHPETERRVQMLEKRFGAEKESDLQKVA